MLRPRVMKFGGSSVADPSCMRQVARVVTPALPLAPLVVLSAMGKTTDALFRAARTALEGDVEGALAQARALIEKHRAALADLLEGGTAGPVGQGAQGALVGFAGELELLLRGVALLRELTPRSMDAIASFGERLSTRLFAALLERQGVQVVHLDARTVIRTDATFGCGAPQMRAIEALAREHVTPLLGPGRVVVTQGYIGATEAGTTTTLGRGGSDYSAALFGAAVHADEIQIWTDVEGVLTADPRIVPAARPIPRMSFAEAAELAAFGAKVLHPATVQPAIEAGIPVSVRDTRRPDGAWTMITGEVTSGRAITALASRGPITVLTVRSSRMLAQAGFLARLFDVFGRLGVSVDLVATAEVSVSLTVDQGSPLAPLLAELRQFATVDVAEKRAIVAVVGDRLKHTPGLGGAIFSALAEAGVNVEMISMGASEINLSLVVREEHAALAVRRLHERLLEGPGAVGLAVVPAATPAVAGAGL